MTSAASAREPSASAGTARRRGNATTRTGLTSGAQVTIAAAAKSQKGTAVGM